MQDSSDTSFILYCTRYFFRANISPNNRFCKKC